MTDEAAPGIEDAPLTEVVLGGTRVLGEVQPSELHGASLASGGKKGALLTALAYSAVRSHQAVCAAGSPLPKERKAGPIARVPSVEIEPEQRKEKAMHRSAWKGSSLK